MASRCARCSTITTTWAFSPSWSNQPTTERRGKIMLIKLGRALGVALSCLVLAPSHALWAVSMPTPGQRLTLGDAIGFMLENHPRRLAASSEAGAPQQQGREAESALLPQGHCAPDLFVASPNGIGA